MLKKGLQLVLTRSKSNVAIQYVNSDKATEAIGPYVHATVVGDMIFVSGQLGIVRETGDFSGDDVSCQAKQAMFNIQNILEECNSSMNSVVKVTVMLQDMKDFQEVNEIYAKFFDGDKGYPARACVEVAALPKGGLVEIEAIAVVECDEKVDDL